MFLSLVQCKVEFLLSNFVHIPTVVHTEGREMVTSTGAWFAWFALTTLTTKGDHRFIFACLPLNEVKLAHK